MKRLFLLLLLACLPVVAQSPASDPFASLHFLEGTWAANTAGAQGVQASGLYSFSRELGGHVMARHATSDPGCKAPASFDCKHGDLLYIYLDAPGQPLRAIYFDNEGHTLHYTVATPTPTTAVFVSEPGYGPQLRLLYELKDGVLYGKFQVMPPEATEWKSYLEWSGGKRPA